MLIFQFHLHTALFIHLYNEARKGRQNNKCIWDYMKAAARQSPNCIKKQNKIKYGQKPFSIWWMEFLHPAMWHVALKSWQWIHQVAAPCNVICDSGMTCHWIRLPRDAMHKRGLRRHAVSRVRLSVRLSVCRVRQFCQNESSYLQTFYCRVAKTLFFCIPNVMAIFRRQLQ